MRAYRFPSADRQALPRAVHLDRDSTSYNPEKTLLREWQDGSIEKRRTGDQRIEELDFYRHDLPIVFVPRPR